MFFFSSRRRHTRYWRDWSSDVCSSDLLETREVAFPQKRALREGRTIVFCDQTGFYLLPIVVRTYAPVGKTPILREKLTRDHLDRKSTRLNSSHANISYAVFCLKKKKNLQQKTL